MYHFFCILSIFMGKSIVIWQNFCTFAPAMRNLPVVTKNLLLINLAVFVLDALLKRYGIYLTGLLGLWYPATMRFHFWQPLTYMFLHADFSHIFCNMFAVLMFAPALEQDWGSKRFAIYYFICGLGAAAVQLLVWHLFPASGGMVTIGASGAVFGVLLAFGWLFPDVEMFLLFIPIPIRARIFVILYAVVELFLGFADLDNVAHFAHLGGMLFGALLILWWNKDRWHLPWPKFPKRNKTEHKGRFKDYHYQEPIR